MKMQPISIKSKFEPLKYFGHLTQQIIMPIVAIADGEMIPLGTGFIIHPDGLMMTAAHVIEDFAVSPPKRRDGTGSYKEFSLYALFISDEKHGDKNQFNNGGLWPIERVWFNDALDIALCWMKHARINDKPFKFPAAVRLSFGEPILGEKTLGFGYYGSKGKITDEIVNGKKVADYSQETAFTQGVVKKIFPIKRDNIILKFPSLEIDARFEPGMSGGPVFNEKGYVCGVICSSMPLLKSGKHLSYVSLLWPSLLIELQMKLEGDNTLKTYKFFDIVKKKLIQVDESIENITISPMKEGEITISKKTNLIH